LPRHPGPRSLGLPDGKTITVETREEGKPPTKTDLHLAAYTQSLYYNVPANAAGTRFLFSAFAVTYGGTRLSSLDILDAIGVYDAHFKFVVFADSQWSYKRLDFDADIGRADRLDNNTINATDPDLRPFIGHGGKLLLYHGWNDVIIAPRNTITYYDQVRRKVGATQADKSVRLFMAPGMAHCDGGEGPSEFDALATLERWVEHGMAPDTITASSSNAGKVVRSRPLCAYPKRAKYVGTGSTDEAKNFRCVTP